MTKKISYALHTFKYMLMKIPYLGHGSEASIFMYHAYLSPLAILMGRDVTEWYQRKNIIKMSF